MKEYPVKLNIDYSESSNRLTAIFRLILVIPIVLILALISTYAEALSLESGTVFPSPDPDLIKKVSPDKDKSYSY